MLKNSSILITGGTGSFGHTFVPLTLKKYNPKRLVIFSRDEMKQWEMEKLYKNDPSRIASVQHRGECRLGTDRSCSLANYDFYEMEFSISPLMKFGEKIIR